MDVIHKCCAGLDVHKKTVHACIRQLTGDGRVIKEQREFDTMTRDLLVLGDWLAAHGVTHVAMESTGVYWKPVWHLLEGRVTQCLCNAQHIKKVPGRKTDTKDAEWLAQLLQYGLLEPSFVPPTPMRELRDLTRQRVQLTHQRTAITNRMQKTLEDANIKLASVASDITGVSGRSMIQAIIAGEQDAEKLAGLARGRLIKKTTDLQIALQGRITEHHRFLLRTLLEQLTHTEQQIASYDDRIDQVIASEVLDASMEAPEALPFAEAVELLDTIPGIDRTSAKAILAEIGTDMSRFPSAGHLASWAGMCPGNNESAGKRKSGKTPKGDRWLRRSLTQAAWAATHTKDSYLGAQYHRLAPRRGKKRAVIAVAHSILVAAYYMLKTHSAYEELGKDHFDQLQPDRLKHRLVRRLEDLGYNVTLDQERKAA